MTDPQTVEALCKRLEAMGEEYASSPRTYRTLFDVETTLRSLLSQRDAAVKRASEFEEALLQSAEAIREFHRYMYGGEMRGSYNGDSERQGLWLAERKARSALTTGGE